MAIANPIQPTQSPSYPEPILSKDQRAALRAQWKQMVAAHTAKCREWDALKGSARLYKRKPEFPFYAHMLYAVLLGRDWRRGCSPISNPRKLANGSIANWRYWGAAAMLSDPFDGMGYAGGLDGFARVAPFSLFVASVPVEVQYKALQRLPTIPTWRNVIWEVVAVTAERPKHYAEPPWPHASDIIDAKWPATPYREE